MKNISLAIFALFVGILTAASAAISAENSIKQIQVRRDGDQLLLKVQMSAPLKAAPGNWSVLEPPRLVFDFPETDNQSGQSAIPVSNGDLKSMNLVQTDKLTRLVLNLFRPTTFSTEISGDSLLIKLSSKSATAADEVTPSVFKPTAPKPDTSALTKAGDAPAASIRDIVFRRGEDGQAIIVLDMTDGSVPVDIRRGSTGITLELRDVELPGRLQNRRDVNDFATPVTTISSRAIGNMTRMDIAARGRWFHQAHLANNQLTIEVKPIPADEANKLLQAGQEGQRVSINFFGADATMVLRTLADISGKNVMIDPSLNGRTVTVNLDNIPYDQALEIIMLQVSASMRVKNDVVLFGDRAVLQKRDQDVADEAARAADTAPLVSETFKLNYAQTSDILALVSSAPAPAAAAAAAAPGAAAAQGQAAAPAAAGGAAAANRGMLSTRGSITAHATSNQIFVRDTAAVVEAIREVIRMIDVPPKQILIEARIVEASTGFTGSLGARLTAGAVQYGGYRVPGTNTNRFALTSAPLNAGTTQDIYGAAIAPSLSYSTNVFRPSYTLAGAANFGLMLFNAAATKLVSLELQAAEQDSKNKTVSSPRIVTMNRKAASINNTQSVTIVTGVNATTGLPIYSTYNAPLTLGVTPSVNPDNRISLELSIAKGTITNATTGSMDNNTITTSVIVENGGTVVIGGFAREADTSTVDRVPVLGDIPYLGNLFKTTSKTASRSELLVFITPRIVTDSISQR